MARVTFVHSNAPGLHVFANMLRYRRHRVFFIFAVLLTLVLVRLSRTRDWGTEGVGTYNYGNNGDSSIERPPPTRKTSRPVVDIEHIAHSVESAHKSHDPPSRTVLKQTKPIKTLPTVPPVGFPDRHQAPPLDENEEPFEDIHVQPPGRVGAQPPAVSPHSPSIHWKKQKEHFPIPASAMIPLPKGRPVAMPKIQHAFEDESADAKIIREKRQANVKAEFSRAWNGYSSKAWMHDELSPVTGSYRDPFCGWAATLIDSLDTLWIMGMKEDFEKAVKAVDNIDFTTTFRGDIPVFETTIRYLGGLLAAYDVSGGKYKILLNKAVELGEILMGVFDTPNRMPILSYQWRPAYASQPHRASTRTNFAELGSLSMEFTRLAQLTKESKYYDAVARITDALIDWQRRGTGVPGLFPEDVDASGCNRSMPVKKPHLTDATPRTDVKGYEPAMPNVVQEQIPYKGARAKEGEEFELQVLPGEPSKGRFQKIESDPQLAKQAARQVRITDTGETMISQQQDNLTDSGITRISDGDWDCVPQGLEAMNYGREEYSMGGGQDSTYEYFLKQYLLLGGLEEKYQTLYLNAMDAVREHLLYRPMVPGNRDILFSGKQIISGGSETYFGRALEAEVTHLACFVGGMIGMGAKIFQIESDVEIGKKLSDGCVWAYESMPSGIMPESATAVACQSQTDCTWNETLWKNLLDPAGNFRDQQVREYDENKKKLEGMLKVDELEDGKHPSQTKLSKQQKVPSNSTKPQGHKTTGIAGALPSGGRDPAVDVKVGSPPGSTKLSKEQKVASNSTKLQGHKKTGMAEALPPGGRDPSVDVDVDSPPPVSTRFEEKHANDGNSSIVDEVSDPAPALPRLGRKLPPDPNRPISHEEYVRDRIEGEGLVPGFLNYPSRKYILRPEAVESVWYMYRITGDTKWQDKGWRMFESIINVTSTINGHTGVSDVTKFPSVVLDEMESFWLSETLKYFYLLFSTPDVISLDEWVLNTEAHPFKRPV